MAQPVPILLDTDIGTYRVGLAQPASLAAVVLSYDRTDGQNPVFPGDRR
jgi:hypothetical protein